MYIILFYSEQKAGDDYAFHTRINTKSHGL